MLQRIIRAGTDFKTLQRAARYIHMGIYLLILLALLRVAHQLQLKWEVF